MKLNLLPKSNSIFTELRKDPKGYLLSAIVFIVVFGLAGFVIHDIMHENEKRNTFKDDVKARCEAVYRTLNGSNVTTIYTCPDDTKYEFSENL